MPPSSTGRYEDVQRETMVPSIVGRPERLKYLFAETVSFNSELGLGRIGAMEGLTNDS